MKKETLITTIVLLIGLVMFFYGAVMQNRAKAGDEFLELQKRNLELEKLIEQSKDAWWIAEDAKQECIESWNIEQKKEEKNADSYRAEISSNEEKMGLLLQSQLQ